MNNYYSLGFAARLVREPKTKNITTKNLMIYEKVASLHSDKYLVLGVLESAVELPECDGARCHHAHLGILSYYYAALAVGCRVAYVYQHAVECRYVQQSWQIAVAE